MAREKQIEFPPNQTHKQWLPWGMFVLSVICIVVVIIVVLSYPEGEFIGPW